MRLCVCSLFETAMVFEVEAERLLPGDPLLNVFSEFGHLHIGGCQN